MRMAFCLASGENSLPSQATVQRLMLPARNSTTGYRQGRDRMPFRVEWAKQVMAWQGVETATRREDSLIDGPAFNNRLSCGYLTRLPGIRRAAVAV